MTYDEANEFIKNRKSKLTGMRSHEISRSVPPKIRAHCFFSARVADARVLEKIREISDAFSAGRINQSEARNQLRTWLRGNGQDDGTASVRNLGSKARVDLILTQNKRMAVAVGKYAKDRDPAVEARFPSWVYHCGRNPRPDHKALDGKVFLKSDPIWHKIFPPWEFNCNCWVENSDKTPSGGISAAQIQPPASGYQFDPSDAFEDYKVDNYDFDHPDPPSVQRARVAAKQLKREELKRMYRDVEDRQPGLIAQADYFWDDLTQEERDVVTRYTASDELDLNRASRGIEDMTDERSDEMDRLSNVLEKAPKYTGGSVYRCINLDTDEKLEKLNENLNNSIFGLSGFNSTSVTMEAATHYAQDNAKYKIMFHVVRSRSGAFIGQHSWINTDKEVLFDRKCKFRALQPWEPGYIKEDVVKDGFRHIAIVEV